MKKIIDKIVEFIDKPIVVPNNELPPILEIFREDEILLTEELSRMSPDHKKYSVKEAMLSLTKLRIMQLEQHIESGNDYVIPNVTERVRVENN